MHHLSLPQPKRFLAPNMNAATDTVDWTESVIETSRMTLLKEANERNNQPRRKQIHALHAYI